MLMIIPAVSKEGPAMYAQQLLNAQVQHFHKVLKVLSILSMRQTSRKHKVK